MKRLALVESKPEVSRVSERLSWLIGKQVRVQATSTDGQQLDDSSLIYIDCVPMGRAYFFVFEDRQNGGIKVLVRTDSVVSMEEVTGQRQPGQPLEDVVHE